MSTTIEGVFIAGSNHYPKDVGEAVTQAIAATGKVASKLVPGKKLNMEVLVTDIDEDVCSGCQICVPLCPYKAIVYDAEKNVSAVNELLCHGCGTCTAGCPSGAAKSIHFTDEQLYEEIEGVLR